MESSKADSTSQIAASVSLIESTLKYIAEQLKAHGILFVFLFMTIMYFYNENEHIKAKIDACEESRLEQEQTYSRQMMEALNNNTAALQKIGFNFKPTDVQ